MSFWDRYHFIPREWVSRRSDPRNSTRSKPDITPRISFSNCCMAFLLGSPLWILIHPTTYIIRGTPTLFAACRYAGHASRSARVLQDPLLDFSPTRISDSQICFMRTQTWNITRVPFVEAIQEGTRMSKDLRYCFRALLKSP